jgi:hypothetical protein
MLSHPRGKPEAVRCLRRAKGLRSAGVRVVVPMIANYEIRATGPIRGGPCGVFPLG